jgi:hypothetical protein
MRNVKIMPPIKMFSDAKQDERGRRYEQMGRHYQFGVAVPISKRAADGEKY